MRRESDAFLAKHNPTGTVPLPLDDVVEYGLGIEVRPFSGLRRDYGRHGMVFSKNRLIVVDGDVDGDNLFRYRFTLAHEIGHLVLHSDFFGALDDSDEASLLSDLANVDAHDAGRMEREASNFAGRILVPTDALEVEVESIRQEILQKGLDIKDMREASHGTVSQILSRKFEVAAEVVRRRLEEGLP